MPSKRCRTQRRTEGPGRRAKYRGQAIGFGYSLIILTVAVLYGGSSGYGKPGKNWAALGYWAVGVVVVLVVV